MQAFPDEIKSTDDLAAAGFFSLVISGNTHPASCVNLLQGDADVAAFNDVDFTVRPGEFVSVIGPSGAGKSTLLRCINRLIEPTEGSIEFLGEDITHLPERRLRAVHRQIAMIFQNYNLVYRLTVIQNVLHGRLGYKNALAGALGIYTESEKVRAFEISQEEAGPAVAELFSREERLG